jgi:hypothetical protein
LRKDPKTLTAPKVTETYPACGEFQNIPALDHGLDWLALYGAFWK